jgi:hypothetical protein
MAEAKQLKGKSKQYQDLTDGIQQQKRRRFVQNTCWLLLAFCTGDARFGQSPEPSGVAERRGHERSGRAGAGSGSGGEWVAAG